MRKQYVISVSLFQMLFLYLKCNYSTANHTQCLLPVGKALLWRVHVAVVYDNVINHD